MTSMTAADDQLQAGVTARSEKGSGRITIAGVLCAAEHRLAQLHASASKRKRDRGPRSALFLTLILVTGVTITLQAQRAGGGASHGVDERTKSELLEARDAIWHAWFAGDTIRLAQLMPEAVAAGSDSLWADRRTTVDEAKHFAAGGGTLDRLTFTNTEISLVGNVAIIRARFAYVTERQGHQHNSSGRVTEVFVRRNGRWVNPFWHMENVNSP